MARRLLWQVGLRRKVKGNWGVVVIGGVRRGNQVLGRMWKMGTSKKRRVG
jgi:hypothetical protein